MKMYSQVITPGKELTDRWMKEGVRLEKYVSPAVYWYAFNNDDRVLGASKSLRQALCLAFDVEKEIDILYNGRGIRATNVVPHGFEAHDEAGTGPYAKFDLELARKKTLDAKKELAAAGVIAEGDSIPR